MPDKCDKIWKERKRLNRHSEKFPGESVKHVFPGGVYHLPPHPLKPLRKANISIPNELFYPYRIVFDFEVYFSQTKLPTVKSATGKTVFTHRHEPLSVGICSNVPGEEDPICLISDGDPQKLIDDFVDRLEIISDVAFNLLRSTTF